MFETDRYKNKIETDDILMLPGGIDIYTTPNKDTCIQCIKE